MWPVHWAVRQANGGNSGQVETLPLACKQEVLKYVVLGYFNKEIADKLHFADTASFSKFFLRLKGSSPKEYRMGDIGKN